jgi:hypothetical protein
VPRSFDYNSPSIAIGALPDANPNTTPPAASRVFKSPERSERDEACSTVQYGLVMNAAGTVDVTVWVHDRRSDNWFATTTEVGVANDQLMEVVGIAGANVFFQLTNPATFATVVIAAEAVA